MGKNKVRVNISGTGSFSVPAGVRRLTVVKQNIGVLPEDALYGVGENAAAFGVTSGGYAVGWGLNNQGVLGVGDVTSRSSPTFVIGGHIFKKISAARALKSDGSIWAWGEHVGDGTIIPKSSPVAVAGGHSFVTISGSRYGCMALKADGSVWGWGDTGLYGTIGDGTNVSKSSPVATIGGHSFVAMSASTFNTTALKADGSLWVWGNGAEGQMGDGTAIGKSSPIQVVGHTFAKLLRNPGFCIGGIKADGSLWLWGRNSQGQIGDNTVVNKSTPTQVVGGHSFVDALLSPSNTVHALKADGSVWTWGVATNGSLGDNTIVNKSSPVQVVGGHSFFVLGCNSAMKEDGTVWTWGSGTSGQIGDNTIVPKSSPVQVVGSQIFMGALNLTQRYEFDVTPGQLIAYNAFGFGAARMAGPWTVEYEA